MVLEKYRAIQHAKKVVNKSIKEETLALSNTKVKKLTLCKIVIRRHGRVL